MRWLLLVLISTSTLNYVISPSCSGPFPHWLTISKFRRFRRAQTPREHTLTAQTLPSQNPQAEAPPANALPTQTPPTQTPPAQSSSAQTPPTQTPPTQTPPAQSSSAQTPPSQTPPAESSSAQTLPTNRPVPVDNLDFNHEVKIEHVADGKVSFRAYGSIIADNRVVSTGKAVDKGQKSLQCSFESQSIEIEYCHGSKLDSYIYVFITKEIFPKTLTRLNTMPNIENIPSTGRARTRYGSFDFMESRYLHQFIDVCLSEEFRNLVFRGGESIVHQDILYGLWIAITGNVNSFGTVSTRMVSNLKDPE